jgi:hypothetical protein
MPAIGGEQSGRELCMQAVDTRGGLCGGNYFKSNNTCYGLLPIDDPYCELLGSWSAVDNADVDAFVWVSEYCPPTSLFPANEAQIYTGDPAYNEKAITSY